MNWQTDGSLASVQSAVTSAASGDTVLIPAGTFSWAGSLSITKAIFLVGAGQNQTFINNNYAAGVMLGAQSGSDGHIVISGIYFKQVVTPTQGTTWTVGVDRHDAYSTTVMIHDCTFDSNAFFIYMLMIYGNGILVWNCTFIGSGSNGLGGINISCGRYGNGLQTGRGTWNTPSTMGVLDTDGLNNTYVEDCSFRNAPSSTFNSDDNARVVIRHCSITDAAIINHGQETAAYGIRHHEIYNNTFHNINAASLLLNTFIYMRGGVFVIANNVFDLPPASKYSMNFTVQAINRADTIPCQTAYPAARQVGQGWSSGSSVAYGNPVVANDGTGAILDPCYVWGNTGPGGDAFANEIAIVDYTPDECGHGLTSVNFIQPNRDYYVGTARPGWAPYAYPHPLRATVPATPSGGGSGPMVINRTNLFIYPLGDLIGFQSPIVVTEGDLRTLSTWDLIAKYGL